MTSKEFYESKIRALKQWIFLLMNYPEDDLGLPKGMSKREALDNALDEINYYRNLIKLMEDDES